SESFRHSTTIQIKVHVTTKDRSERSVDRQRSRLECLRTEASSPAPCVQFKTDSRSTEAVSTRTVRSRSTLLGELQKVLLAASLNSRGHGGRKLLSHICTMETVIIGGLIREVITSFGAFANNEITRVLGVRDEINRMNENLRCITDELNRPDWTIVIAHSEATIMPLKRLTDIAYEADNV
ncbi:hypothetical protein EJB05_55694, partial [Eragrostis curvula]